MEKSVGKKRKINNNVLKLLIITLSALFLFASQNFIFFLALFSLIVSVLLFIKTKDNSFLFIISLFIMYSNYSIVVAYYTSLIELHSSIYVSKDFLLLSIKILQLFMSIVYVCLPKTVVKVDSKTCLKSNCKYYLLSFVSLLIAFVIVFGNYILFSSKGQRNDVNALGEYSLIFVIIGLYFAIGSKKCFVFAHFVVLSICVIVFVNGGRILGLQMIFALFICLYSNKFSKPKLFIILLAGLILLTIVGSLRENFSLNFENIGGAFKQLFGSWFTLDTSYAAYHASNVFLKVASKQTFSDRFIMFVKFIMSMFFGGSLISNSNLSTFTSTFYFHGGGGLLPYYFYYYLGYFGVILISVILGYYLKCLSKINEKSKPIYKVLAIYITCTCPRWYLYSPSDLFRGVILFVVVFFLLTKTFKITTRFYIKKNQKYGCLCISKGMNYKIRGEWRG